MTRAKMFGAFLSIGLGGAGLIVAIFPDVWSAGGAALRAVSIVHLMPILFATLVVQGPLLKQPIRAPLGLRFRPNRWFLVAWLAPLGALTCAVLSAWLLFGVEPVLDAATYIARKRAALPAEHLEAFDRALAASPPPSPLWFVVQGMPVGITLNLLLALATEVGFRGFLFREIQGGFWRRTALIGLAEAAWLVPPAALGFHFAGPGIAGALSMFAFCLLASPLLVYLRVRANSVVACAAFRGTLLALASAAADLTMGASPLVRPFHGLSGLLGLAAVLAMFFLHDAFVAEQRLMLPRRTQPVRSGGSA